jgi:hypothetical protein
MTVRGYKTYKKNVKLAPGQALHYTAGKGYWAGPKTAPGRPAPPRPVDPFAPIPAAQLEQRATQMAAAQLAPERAEIERQRAIAAAAARGDRSEIMGLAQAVHGMTAGIGPAAQAAYSQGAAQLGAMAEGVGQGFGSRLTELGGDATAFAQSQGAPVAGVGPDVGAMQAVNTGLNGVVPGASMLAQGAAAGAWGAGLGAITAAAMRGDYARAMYEAKVDDDRYAQQLIQTAAKSPELRNQALEALRDYEMKKASFKLDQTQQAAQLRIQDRAQTLYERQFGEEVRSNQVGEQIKRTDQALEARSLMLDGAKYELDTKEHAARVKQAQAKGRQIDAAASKVYGFIVDKQGNFVLDGKGRKIKVKQASTGSGSSRGTAEERNPQGAAIEAARVIRGEPVKADADLYRGQYIARKGIKGVFPDGSTDNPSLAKRDGDMTFAEAITYIMGRYKRTRAQARAALIASGWKPDGVRPKGRTSGA